MITQKAFAGLSKMIDKKFEVFFWAETVNNGNEYALEKDSITLDAKSNSLIIPPKRRSALGGFTRPIE